MRYLSLGEVLRIHSCVMSQSGGAAGVRDLPGLESAVAQPRATFDGADLHLTPVEKAAALCFCLVANHPFVDGNKRTAHAAMEVFLVLNGYEIEAEIDEQERIIVEAARGERSRGALAAWLTRHVKPRRE